MDDIVIDANVACLFDQPPDSRLKPLFVWLATRGCLAVSQHLLNEYSRQGNRLLAVLLRDMQDQRRLNKISNAELKAFKDDRHYNYVCNGADVPNARTVFLSCRKLLVSFDVNLRDDVNGFRKIDRVQPRAFDYPPAEVLT